MLRANYQDGQSTRVRVVSLSLSGRVLAVAGDDIDLRIPIDDITVDERLGNAPRRLRFPDGAYCEVRDLQALDMLLQAMGHRDGWVDRVQRRLAFVGFSIVAFAAVVAATYLWLLPWAVEIASHHIPPSVDAALSVKTIQAMDGSLFQPSELSEERRGALTTAFEGLKLPEAGRLTPKLLFRKSKQLHANAITFPNGTIVLLDDLVTLMSSDAEIIAVLSHELGHAYNRHGVQSLLRSSIVAAFWTFYLGDISGLLATAPAAIAEARYSQEFEREADNYGADLLRRNGISPGKLADALERLKESAPEMAGGGYLSTHPAMDERIARLRGSAPPP